MAVTIERINQTHLLCERAEQPRWVIYVAALSSAQVAEVRIYRTLNLSGLNAAQFGEVELIRQLIPGTLSVSWFNAAQFGDINYLPAVIVAGLAAAVLAEIEPVNGLTLEVDGLDAGELAEVEPELEEGGGGSVLDDVLSYYAFEDTPGFAVDTKGVANLTNAGATQGSSGIRGESSAGFTDGASDHMRRAGTYTAGQLTLTGWFFRTNSTANQAMFDLSGDDRMFVRNTDLLVFRAKNGGSNAEAQVAGVSTYFPTFTWTHLAFVFDGAAGTHSVYINGELRGTAAGAGSTVAGQLYIGNLSSGSWQWTGDIDEIAIWNRPLTGAEVAELYNGGSGLFL